MSDIWKCFGKLSNRRRKKPERVCYFFWVFHLKAFVILKKKEEFQVLVGQLKLLENLANQKVFGFSLHYKICCEKKI